MWPISSTTSVAVSRSIGWLMVAITPMFSMVLMTSVALTAIFCAISCGVMVSPMVTSRLIGAVGISNAWRRLDAHAAGAGAFLDALLLLVARADAAGDVQLLASVTRCPWPGSTTDGTGAFSGLWRSGRAAAVRGRGFQRRRGAALPVSCLARASSCARRGFFGLLLAAWLRLRCGGGSPPPCARFPCARLPGARARRLPALPCSLRLRVGFVLVLLVLLFENVALDVGLLVADFDVHRARAALRARLLELALRLARQRDLARRGGATRSCWWARRRHARGAGA